MENRRGFTLVELLVAIGIIGVLASIAMISLNSVRQKGRDAKRISEVQNMQKALETFYSTNGSYPLGVANAAIIDKLGEQTTVPPIPPAATDPIVLCTLDSVADNNLVADAFGGLGFRGDTTAATNAGAAGCVGSPFMNQVAKDPEAPNKHMSYQASSCAADGNGVAIAPCTSYTITFKLEAGTGSYPGGVDLKATPNGIAQ